MLWNLKRHCEAYEVDVSELPCKQKPELRTPGAAIALGTGDYTGLVQPTPVTSKIRRLSH